MNRTAFLIAAAVLAAPALAQTDIDPAHKMCWGENIGWLNWRDAGDPAGQLGVRLHATFLSGFVWGENVGWINMGDGAPENGASYANATGADFGVNRDPATGALSGMAWGENIGWINFGGGALATPARPARFDAAAGRFRGYAWGENVGWINLDDATHYVGASGAPACTADFDASGAVDVADIFAFLSAWFAMEPRADLDGVAGIAVGDIFAFLSAWFAGC